MEEKERRFPRFIGSREEKLRAAMERFAANPNPVVILRPPRDQVPDGFRNRRWVLSVTGLSAPTIWRLEAAGKFPRRRQLTPSRVGWLESEVLEWVNSRPVVGAGKEKK